MAPAAIQYATTIETKTYPFYYNYIVVNKPANIFEKNYFHSDFIYQVSTPIISPFIANSTQP
jgi:hypothetical protein